MKQTRMIAMRSFFDSCQSMMVIRAQRRRYLSLFVRRVSPYLSDSPASVRLHHAMSPDIMIDQPASFVIWTIVTMVPSIHHRSHV